MHTRLLILWMFVITISWIATPAAAQTIALDDETTIRFATKNEGEALLGTADGWVRAFGPLDRQLRMRSKEPVTEKAFLAFAAENALEWDPGEIAKMTRSVESVRSKIAELSLNLDLPAEILLVQTTGAEEGDIGGYTRDTWIVVPESMMEKPEMLDHFFLHELFHVMTRHNPDIRIPLYALVGFEHCGDIDYPKQLMSRKITNPDAYHFDACVKVSAGDREIYAMPLTLSRSESYVGGNMFSYVTIQFLEIELADGKAIVKYVDDAPVLYEMPDIKGYADKIGGNTGYVIHPEEIMAENFAMAILQTKDVPNPEILEGVIKVLSERD